MTDDTTPIKPDLSTDIDFLNKMKSIEKSRKMYIMRIGNKTILSNSSRLLLEENAKKINKIYKGSDL